MQYRDADLVRRIGEVTALETRASGAQYAFAPCVAVSYICQNINHPTSMFHHAKYVHFYICNAFWILTCHQVQLVDGYAPYVGMENICVLYMI